VSSISFKLTREVKHFHLKTDERVSAEQVDPDAEVEVEIRETPFFSVFNQESTIITKIK